MRGRIDVTRLRTFLALTLALFLSAVPVLGTVAQDATPAADNSEIEIAYVLHGLNAFTERMKTGAEDAGRDYGVTLEVFGDASFETPTHQAFFETALQRGFDGIALVTLPGDQWITPIQIAVDQGVPLVGANVTALESALTTWVGQDEYNSGVILGNEMKKQFDAAGLTEGKIAVGICDPAAQVLQDRDAGLRKGLEGTNFEILEAQDVDIPVPDNYARWENIIAANPDIVAAVGLCSIDIPNLAQLKERNAATWLIGGYDLDLPTLQAIQDGLAQVTVGQQEYLQGYLPVRALAEHLINGTPLVEGWLETPTEVVTADNVSDYVSRQSDNQVQYDYYQEYMDQNFADLEAAARPYDDLRNPGMARATPEP
ncbi:MAG: ribose transport system substrate-binding protein [Thermomicrobiales bacterium]|jgi:ABC-type sugar transport system substrate-binding protein|nr:ribose transport system substrate-binding protein [Thermomicrobiales bacterium]